MKKNSEESSNDKGKQSEKQEEQKTVGVLDFSVMIAFHGSTVNSPSADRASRLYLQDSF